MKTFRFLFLTFFIFMTQVACEQTEELSSSEFAVASPSEENNSNSGRVYLKNATQEELEPFIIEEDGYEKLIVCQVPVGQPLEFKNVLIHMEALSEYLDQSLESQKYWKASGAHDPHYIYKDDDYLGACGAPEYKDDVIVLDDPVMEGDGFVCEDLEGDDLFECLKEHDQNITIEL